MKFFWGLLAIIFIKPIIGIMKFFWMIISFAVQLLFYKLLFKILDWLFKLHFKILAIPILLAISEKSLYLTFSIPIISYKLNFIKLFNNI